MQWLVLLVASYIFYAFSGIKLLIFLLLTTVVTFYTGRWLGKVNEQTSAYLDVEKKNLTREEKKSIKISRYPEKEKYCYVLY